MNQLPFFPAQLQQYLDVCWIESYFTPTEVDQISNLFDDLTKDKAQTTASESFEPDFRKSTIAFVPPRDHNIQHILTKLSQLAIQINAQRYHFDLMGFYEDIQIAEYGQNDFFKWHSDFGNLSTSNRKLSLSVQLTDPTSYEGGDLQFMNQEDGIVAPKSIGTVVIFPSYVMHCVSPITSGKRKSLVGWVSGPPFR